MAYIGNQPVLQTTQFRDEFFPTSNQTAFTTGGFHPSAVSVTRNGVLLSESDYTKGSDNVTITLANAAVSGDVIVIYGNRSLAQGVSVSESRVEYTWQSGDTYVQLNADVIPAYTDVYLNGVKLAAADYSINASTKQVSFTSAPAVGDVIAVVHKNETSALVALPLKDSSGAAILSESGGTVTLTADSVNIDGGTIDGVTIGGSSAAAGTFTTLNTSGNVTLGGNLVIPDSGTIGSASDTDAITIDSSGLISVNGATTTGHISIDADLTQRAALTLKPKTNSYTSGIVVFQNYSGSNVGYISINTTTTTYATSSDYRLKENITEITDGIQRVKQLNPSRFNFITDPDKTIDGFIAHEVFDIVPEAVSGEKDAVNEDGSINAQGLDLSKLVPLLTAAMQESIAKIESLETRISQLESK